MGNPYTRDPSLLLWAKDESALQCGIISPFTFLSTFPTYMCTCCTSPTCPLLPIFSSSPEIFTRTSRDNRTCNYCKKPGHIKADCHTLKARNETAQRDDQKGARQEEVNYIVFSAEVLLSDSNILSIENTVK